MLPAVGVSLLSKTHSLFMYTVMALLCTPVSKLVSCTFSTIPICVFPELKLVSIGLSIHVHVYTFIVLLFVLCTFKITVMVGPDKTVILGHAVAAVVVVHYMHITIDIHIHAYIYVYMYNVQYVHVHRT